MNKKIYENPEISVIALFEEDVLTASTDGFYGEEDSLLNKLFQ